MLQDFALDGIGRPVEPNMMGKMSGREGSLVTTSGKVLPALELQRDGWLRLRIVNASSSRFYRLRIRSIRSTQLPPTEVSSRRLIRMTRSW